MVTHLKHAIQGQLYLCDKNAFAFDQWIRTQYSLRILSMDIANSSLGYNDAIESSFFFGHILIKK